MSDAFELDPSLIIVGPSFKDRSKKISYREGDRESVESGHLWESARSNRKTIDY